MRRLIHSGLSLLGCLWLALVCTACRSAPPLPAADLSQPGWTVRQGQAVWIPRKGKSELSGELLVATHRDGDLFVQFAKPPFPMVSAQTVGNQWRIEFGANMYSGGGEGKPPARFGWFGLPGVLANEPPPGKWQFTTVETNHWRFWNPRTGENLEGYLSP